MTNRTLIAGAILIATIASHRSQAQSFDVASVKTNTTGPGPTMIQMDPRTGRATVTNATFRMLLRTAYRVQDYQIIGGPDWMNAVRFDIQAKPDADFKPDPAPATPCIGPGCPPNAVQLMMQGLLADRFQFKMHRETRELPVYDLTVGKNGPKLKEVPEPPRPAPGALPPPPPPPPPPPGPSAGGALPPLPTPPPGAAITGSGGFAASAVPLATLVQVLSQLTGRPVIDKTGIKGFFDFKLQFSPEGLAGGPPPPAGGGPGLTTGASDPAPSLFTALQEQLGLKLESTKGSVPVIVIDSVQRPTEN